MNRFVDRCIISLLLGLSASLAFGQAEVETDAAVAELEESRANAEPTDRFSVIVDRNPFNLQPPAPPPPPKEEEEPEEEEVSLKELNITLAGVSAKNGRRRVWISMTLPPSQAEEKPVERFFGLGVGEQQHGVTIKSIEPNGDVEIVYSGTEESLSFDTHGFKKKKPAKPKGKTNVRTARTTSNPGRTVTARTGNSRSTPSSRTVTPRTGGTTGGGRTVPVGRSTTSNVRSIPSRPVRTPPKPALSRDEQIGLIQAQKALAEQEGLPFPPLPPLR